MSPTENTFMEMSGRNPDGSYRWTTDGMIQRFHTEYKVEDRNTGKYEFFGKLLDRNPPQRELAAYLCRRLEMGGKIRLILGKSRRVGWTTLLTTVLFDVTRFCKGMRAGVLSHTDDSTRVVHNMMWGLWKRLPPERRPSLEAKSASELVLGADSFNDLVTGKHDGITSSIVAATARGENPMTGDGMRWEHYSEMGKYHMNMQRQRRLWTSAYGALAPGGPSVCLIESTPQGENNMFASFFKASMAIKLSGRAANEDADEFTPWFCPSDEDPSNRYDIEPGYNWMQWPASDKSTELRIIEHLQKKGTRDILRFMRFRRSKISMYERVTNGDFEAAIRLFNEEYPIFWEEMFSSTNSSAIPGRIIDETERRYVCEPELFDWSLEEHDAPFGPTAVSWGDDVR